MDLEQRLRASLVAPNPGAVFTARVMARLGRGAARRRSSFILTGTVLVVGAAAAMLAWQWSDVQPGRLESTAVPEVSGPGPVVQPVAQEAPQVSESVAAAPEPAPMQAASPVETSPRFSVLVMPLRQEAQDAARHRPAEAFHAALIEELRKVPGLTLLVAHEPGQGTESEADFVVTLTNLAAGVAPTGGVTFSATDGGNRYTVNADNRLASIDIDYGIKEITESGGANFFFTGEWGSMTGVSVGGGVVSFHGASVGSPENVSWVELRVEPRQLAASRYTFPVGAEGAGRQQLAATQVGLLRLQVFPVDAAFQQRVMSRLGASGQDGAKVLQDLLPLLSAEGGARLEPATTRALFRYVAGQPADTRARVWKALNQVTHPELLAPMVESLRRDPDRQVRLAALANLEANYSGAPVVRSAYESIDREDRDPVVRAAVRWTLYGEAQWRNDVLTALQDTTLPYAARLTPLVARTPADFSPQQSFRMSTLRGAVLKEEQVLRPVMALVRENLRDPGQAQMTGEVLGMLGNVEDTAVVDLFLQLMREESLPIQLSGPVGSWAFNHRNDPRVREILPLVEPTIPSGLLERMREVAEKTASPPLMQ